LLLPKVTGRFLQVPGTLLLPTMTGRFLQVILIMRIIIKSSSVRKRQCGNVFPTRLSKMVQNQARCARLTASRPCKGGSITSFVWTRFQPPTLVCFPRAHTHMHIYICTYAHMHAHMRTRTHTCTHSYIRAHRMLTILRPGPQVFQAGTCRSVQL
jgi:hypothetical protein